MRAFWRQTFQIRPRFSWEATRDYSLILLGTVIQAVSLRTFLVPANLASGGVSGLAQIINHHTGWPIGLMVLVGNLPLFLLGWRTLGGPKFALRTAFAVLSFSILIDLSAFILPAEGLTQDLTLNALYGGVISGIGFGLVYRGRGTSGGSDILARILQNWKGVSLSQSYLMIDGIIMFLAGLSFSWENALYALVMLYVSGITAETISEGSKVVRTVMIITAQPELVKEQILHGLGRGVTEMVGRGGYTGVDRPVLYCVVSRAEVMRVKALVSDADPHAFMVIGNAHEVLGEGFRPFEIEK